jgi:hypothetical protein
MNQAEVERFLKEALAEPRLAFPYQPDEELVHDDLGLEQSEPDWRSEFIRCLP